jgi:DNA-binding IclR family transcriptional regulator
MSVLDYLQVIDGDYQQRTIDNIAGHVQADRQSIERALETLSRDGFVRRSGEFWLPLNPNSAFSSIHRPADS